MTSQSVASEETDYKGVYYKRKLSKPHTKRMWTVRGMGSSELRKKKKSIGAVKILSSEPLDNKVDGEKEGLSLVSLGQKSMNLDIIGLK